MNGDFLAYKRLIRRFAELHQDDMAQIRDLYGDADPKGATMIAHSLRGAAGNIGAEDLMAMAARLEAAIKNGESASVVEQAATETAIELDTLVGVILAAPEHGAGIESDQAPGGVDVQRKLDELEAALAAGDVQANQIFKASAELLHSALGSPCEDWGVRSPITSIRKPWKP